MPILGKTNMDEFAMGSLHRALRLRRRATTRGTSTRIPGGSGGGSSCGRRVVPGAARDRHRHRRLDPPAGRRHRHGRRQADLRRGLALRPRRAGLQPRPGRTVHPHGARRRPAARGHRRSRPDGLHVDRRPGAAGASRPRGGPTSTGLRIGVVRELGGEGYQAGVQTRFDEAVQLLVDAGAEVVEVSCPSFDLRARRLLPDPAERGVEQPRQVRRHALRPAGRCPTASRPQRRAGHGRHPRRRLRRRGQAPHHPRHLRPVQRLLRRLLRLGAEGAPADRRRLHRGVRAGRRAGQPRPRRPRRSRSATSSTTRWRCTSTTSRPSRPTWPACPGMSVPSGPRPRGRPADRLPDPRPGDAGRPAVCRRRGARGARSPTAGVGRSSTARPSSATRPARRRRRPER